VNKTHLLYIKEYITASADRSKTNDTVGKQSSKARCGLAGSNSLTVLSVVLVICWSLRRKWWNSVC